MRGIVHHHGQLVGPEAIGAQQDEVADLGIHALHDAPVDQVVEGDFGAVRYPQADGGIRARRGCHAAAVDTAGRGQVGAAAMAFEGEAVRQ